MLFALRALMIFVLFSLVVTLRAQAIEVLAIEYPPFTTEKDPTGGISFIRLNSYADTLTPRRVFTPVFVPPARAEHLFTKGHYCLAFFPPRSNQDQFDFFPLSEQKVHLGLIRKRQDDTFAWQHFSDLNNKSVAMLRSTVKSPLLLELEGGGVSLVHVDSILQGLRMLISGNVDYAFGDAISLDYHHRHSGIDANKLQLSSSALLEAQIGFHYKKSCYRLLFGEK